MDLGLDLVRTRGRASKAVAVAQVREVTLADLELLAVEKGSTTPKLAELKSRHHALARALAAGLTEAEACLATGYSHSRVSILKNDPAFAELLALYQSDVKSNFDAGMELMKVGHIAAVTELVDRISERPEGVDNADLIKAISTLSDRVGLGPQSKSTNVNVNVDLSSRLEAARRRAGMLIEGESLPSLPAISREEPEA